MKLKVGDPAPPFSLTTGDGQRVILDDMRGRQVVLYFYPKDDTPGCTVEACNFRDNSAQFEAQGATVLGVSADNVKSHQKFANKYGLTFPLLSDPDHAVSAAYESWGEKKFMGRTYEGILRNTFLIDKDGRIKQIWEKVKPQQHVQEVLDALA